MGLLREAIGLLLVVVAWTNVFGMGVEMQMLLFLLGFDFMSLIPKIALFLLDFTFNLVGVGWVLLLVVAVEALIVAFDLKPFVGYILKPLATFLVLYANGVSVAVAFIVAGLDLLLNVSKRYI
ncbi:hypothetical protein A3K63_02485 [Candidatus Micrarchaeota archaeon RBG_16_49_10]|nr:MAG: hypothetical protein A3K63_02485 [Candidatus Micrarchaeota archaeon RBG_16_49_10]